MRSLFLYAPFFLFLLSSCDPLVTEFPDEEDAVYYESEDQTPAQPKDTIHVMTWNVRYGAARLPWFGDSCGDRVLLTEDELETSLSNIAQYIQETDPDILLIQEIDVSSKRTNYMDEVQYLLDHTDLNYGAYASAWQSQFIPSDGLGKMDMGNAILSKWEIVDAVRHQLPLRGDQDALTQMFYLRRNVLEAEIDIGGTTVFAVNVHATAFATDDTKQKHIQSFTDVLERLDDAGIPFVSGGDLNSLPPEATVKDYCLVDMCEEESFHGEADDPEHKEGSWFANQDSTVLEVLYNQFTPAVPESDYLANESAYFTHTPDYSSTQGFDRKLDYLWTNRAWIIGSDHTHWEAAALSDHLPVSARWEVTP